METERAEDARKRMKPSVVQEEVIGGDLVEMVEEETEINAARSERMELGIVHILDKIDRFTQMVSELLEAGKSLLKQLSNDFEERMILIHKDQIEKWQEKISELRLLDASNEEVNVVLHNAKYLLQNVHDS